MKQAVSELKDGLLKLGNPSYNNIDKLMRKIMKKYDLTAKELHYGFRDLNNDKTPDEWIKGEKKMKTFKEFIEEAYLIQEMRKEDKVKGRKPTPMFVSQVYKKAEKTPEGKWEVKKTEIKRPNPEAVMGRKRQGMGAVPGEPSYSAHRSSDGHQYGPQPHGTGGSKRGVKKMDTQQQRRGPTGKTATKKVAERRASREAQKRLKEIGGKHPLFF
jgi:hypothetical protein